MVRLNALAKLTFTPLNVNLRMLLSSLEILVNDGFMMYICL